ncbi:MAG: hypothetical protein NT027_02840 [Proteobacteria bacterium]|nr:hypothetical protein [Pseudomonadota bacterium]
MSRFSWWRKSILRKLKYLFLAAAIMTALTSRDQPLNIKDKMFTSYSAKNVSEVIDVAVVCDAFSDGLMKSGLVLVLHASLPRDENDYQLFSTSSKEDGMFVSINEQRQLVLYFGKASAGYEITVPDPEFITDVTGRKFDKSGKPIIDQLHATLFITRLDKTDDQVALEAMTGSPFSSTVVNVIPLAQITNSRCDETSTIGLGVEGTTGGVDIGKIGKTSKSMLMGDFIARRSIASLFVAMWFTIQWIMRKKDENAKAKHA